MVIQTTRSTTATTQTPTKTTPSKTVRPRKPIRTAPALDLSTLKVEYDPSMEVPKASRPMGLQDAPTYWPTEKEWADPLSYIQSIAEEGKKYGICKVILLYSTFNFDI
jgi:[histone H3]-trimethyl-L-lysine4 demethylase